MKLLVLFSEVFLILILFGVGSCSIVRNDCTCGEANIHNSGRIVNGFKTTKHKYPWMAAMFSSKGSFMCGGSIVSDRTILTAGHCLFYVPNQLRSTWVLGMHTRGISNGVRYRTAGYVMHPYFVNNSFYDDWDMSMVKVDRKIEFNSHIRPICLPPGVSSYDGKKATVAGWGRLGEKRGSPLGEVLMETKVWIKNDRECTDMVKSLMKFNKESMICAYEEKTDACQGDSGGPLFLETAPNRYDIVGTVSFGDGCARQFPGIYGRVSHKATLDWIRSYIDQSGGAVCSEPRKRRRLAGYGNNEIYYGRVQSSTFPFRREVAPGNPFALG